MRRKRILHPATLIATAALFIVLGGTSAAVTGGTDYTSREINGSQLANRSIAAIKLEYHTITGAEIDVAGLPTVPSAVFAGDASLATNALNAAAARTATTAKTATTATTAGTITGTIDGSQVTGTVANATTAKTASTATTAGTITGTINGSQITGAVANATNAANAGTATTAATISGQINGSQVSGAVASAENATNATSLDGDGLANIDVSSSSSTDVALTSSLAGLTLSMRCTGGNVDIDANTATSGASYGISAVANGSATTFLRSQGSFESGTAITLALAGPSQINFSYQQGSNVAAGNFTVFDSSGTCSAFGIAEYSG